VEIQNKKLKCAFIDSSLRPFVKGSDYDELEPGPSISTANSMISEKFDVHNNIQRKNYILKLLSIKHTLPSSTQELINLLEKFFPKIKNDL
jgi:hypothetical protein